MEWLTAAVQTVWSNAGKLPDNVSKWQMYAEIVQIIHELCMRQTIFNLNMRAPDDEWFTTGKRDLVLGTASYTNFGSLITILAPFVGDIYLK